jgi:hypothetical protein
MRFQFGIKAIILLTTAVAIWCGGVVFWSKFIGPETNISWAFTVTGTTAALWMPLVFMAFAIGRKSLTLKMILGFVVCELAALGTSHLAATYY